MTKDSKPQHIQRVDSETGNMFRWIKADTRRMEDIFKLPHKNIDMELAWQVFDEISYSEWFSETAGDSEAMYDPQIKNKVLANICERWPLRYYIKFLKHKGIMDSVPTPDGEIYFIRESYKPSLNNILTASETRDLS
jgi:hypothetical protein